MPKGMLEQYRSSDGHYYQVPWKGNPVMLVYRPDLLKKAGIASFPRTYGSFLKALQAIKSQTGVTPTRPPDSPVVPPVTRVAAHSSWSNLHRLR